MQAGIINPRWRPTNRNTDIIIKLGFLKIVTKAASSSQTIKMQK